MNNPLTDVAQQMVAAKRIQLEPEAQDRLVQEIAAILQDHINAELLSRLTNEQLGAFDSEVTDVMTADETLAFFARNGVDIQDATQTAIMRFKQAYLGA